MPPKTTRKYINLSVDELTIGNGAFKLPVADGVSGQTLITDGLGNVTWQSAAGFGTVTSITAGTGLDGGTITGSGTIDLADTAVTPGSYVNANITVDQQGRITLASSGTVPNLQNVITEGSTYLGTDTVTIFNNDGGGTSQRALTIGNTFNRLQATSDALVDISKIDVANGGQVLLSVTSVGTGSNQLDITKTGMIVTDGILGKGLEYALSYHSGYTLRSLVDKEYVDNAISGSGVSFGSQYQVPRVNGAGNDFDYGGLLFNGTNMAIGTALNSNNIFKVQGSANQVVIQGDSVGGSVLFRGVTFPTSGTAMLSGFNAEITTDGTHTGTMVGVDLDLKYKAGSVRTIGEVYGLRLRDPLLADANVTIDNLAQVYLGELGNITKGSGEWYGIHQAEASVLNKFNGTMQFSDGSEGNIGYVWTSTDIKGTGQWQAISSSSLWTETTAGNIYRNTDVGIGDFSSTEPSEALEVQGKIEVSGADAEFIGDLRGAIRFNAQAGEALSKGDVVYISGISGNTPIVMKADASDSAKMPAFGLAFDAASLNTSVEIVTFGTLAGLDTLTPGWSLGDTLYVSTTPGQLTNTAPTGESSLIQNIGKVQRVDSNGSIKVGGAGRSNATPNLNRGSLFVGNSANQSSTLAIGAVDTFLKSDGTDVSWSTINEYEGLTIGDSITGGTVNTTLREDNNNQLATGTLLDNGSTIAIGSLNPSASLNIEDTLGNGIRVINTKTDGPAKGALFSAQGVNSSGSNNVGVSASADKAPIDASNIAVQASTITTTTTIPENNIAIDAQASGDTDNSIYAIKAGVYGTAIVSNADVGISSNIANNTNNKSNSIGLRLDTTNATNVDIKRLINFSSTGSHNQVGPVTQVSVLSGVVGDTNAVSIKGTEITLAGDAPTYIGDRYYIQAGNSANRVTGYEVEIPAVTGTAPTITVGQNISIGVASSENIGVVANVSGGVANYSLQLVDGTETVAGGRFLKDVGGGKANWADITEADITNLGTYALVGTYGSERVPRWNATTNTLESGSIRDDGSTVSVGTVLSSNIAFYTSTGTLTEAIRGQIKNDRSNQTHAIRARNENGGASNNVFATAILAESIPTSSIPSDGIYVAGRFIQGTFSEFGNTGTLDLTSIQAEVDTNVSSDNVYAIKVDKVTINNSVSGNVYGLYLESHDGLGTVTGNEYGIYQNGTDINYFAGNVGIGTNPLVELHVKGSQAIIRLESSDNTGKNYLEFWDTSAIKGYMGYGSTTTNELSIVNYEEGEVLNMWTTDSGGTTRTAITVDSDQNVTIDNGNLEVAGQVNSSLPTTPITSTATTTVDWNDGNGQMITLAASITTLTLSNPIAGATYFLKIAQDGTGGFTISWPTSIKWPGGTQPVITSAPNAIDTVVLFYDGTDYYGNFAQNYS